MGDSVEALALRAVTCNSAHTYGESDRKGTLEKGKLTDMIMISENPFAIDPMELPNIEVLATRQEGRLVWQADGG